MDNAKIDKMFTEMIMIRDVIITGQKSPFYRILLIKEGDLFLSLNDKRLSLNPPLLLCLNEKDDIVFHDMKNANVTDLCFHPGIINSKLSFHNIGNKNELIDSTDILDSDSFRP